MSTIDPVKLEQFGDSVGKALGKKKVSKQRVSLNQIYKDVIDVVQEEDLENYVEITTSYRGVTIKVSSDISFSSGSAKLIQEIFPLLNSLVPKMKQTDFNIAVEGHTDSDPISTEKYPSNWELSSARAASVVRYFISKGVEPIRFRVIGFAETVPRDPTMTIEEANSSPELKNKNRRVEITFLAIS
jgi:chemotaxis protein MotB